MSETLMGFGRLVVYTHSLFVVLAFFWYSFVIYKKGLEFRYEKESMLDLAVLSALFGFIFSRLGYVITNISTFNVNWLRVLLLVDYPGYNYLGLVLGLVIAVIFLTKRGEIRLFEGLDLLGLGLPGAIAFERLGVVLALESRAVLGIPVEILQAFLFLIIFVWLWKLEREYRTLEWYRFRKTQAKPGFIFGAFLFLSGFLIVGSSIWPVMSLSEIIIGSLSVLSGIVVVYRQSGRSLAYDVKLIPFISKWYTKAK